MSPKFDLEQQILNAWQFSNDHNLLSRAVDSVDVPSDNKSTVTARLSAFLYCTLLGSKKRSTS